jgi:ATP-dependent helicase HrpA
MIRAETLPVYRHRETIIKALKQNQVIVVESPTGSGKTTQIPKILYDSRFAEDGIIGVTQPRRIAAVSVSDYIARQYDTEIPGLVGYKMRFVDETNEDTRITVMTDGILLQEIKTDPLLSRYSVIMVDEAHERSLNIDFILGLLKEVLRGRPEFKVVISSATINTRVFSEYYDRCPVVSIDARMYPVEIVYNPIEGARRIDTITEKIGEIVKGIEEKNLPGDMLIFLSGEGQIKECATHLLHFDKKNHLAILLLYGRLSREEQERVFCEFPGKRKIILATNIAETSVTIDGIRHVVDPGYAKLNYYNPRNFTSSLVEVPISKASCNQRKGRAGRTAPGFCYRLYSKESYNSRNLYTEEEIYRTDLSEVILRMAELGIREFESFDFISNPGSGKIRSAVEVLELLEAIDPDRELTTIGKMMVMFPIIPRISRMIVAAMQEYPDVLEEVLIASAFINNRAPFLLPHGLELEARKAHHSFRHPLGDFVSYLKIFRAYVNAGDSEGFCEKYYLDNKGMGEIYNVKQQLAEIVSDMGVPLTGGGDLSEYLCAVSKGLIQFVCKQTKKGVYSSLTAYGIKIHPGSVMFSKRPEYIVAGEVMRTSQMYAMSVSPLTSELIGRISDRLYNAFVRKKRGAKKKVQAAPRRDYTNYIKIGSERFTIEVDKKQHKVVVLPYDKLKQAVAGTDVADIENYKGLRGRVLLGEYELFGNFRLNRILEIAGRIDEVEEILDRWPKGARYEYITDAYHIVRHIPDILKLCRKKKETKRLGFFTLLTDGNGQYWYSCYRDFLQALEESVSSLETMIDEDINVLDKQQEETVSQTYRRLTEIFAK